jgi:hypothetical protein
LPDRPPKNKGSGGVVSPGYGSPAYGVETWDSNVKKMCFDAGPRVHHCPAGGAILEFPADTLRQGVFLGYQDLARLPRINGGNDLPQL